MFEDFSPHSGGTYFWFHLLRTSFSVLLIIFKFYCECEVGACQGIICRNLFSISFVSVYGGGSEDNLRESLLHLRMIPGNQTEVIKLGNSTFIC